MDRNKEVKTVDDNDLDRSCQDNVNIGALPAQYRQEALDTFEEFQQLWYGGFGCVDMAKHRI